MSSREIVINLHGIGTPHAGVDDAERPYWITEERFLEILDLVDRHPCGNRVRFTFDDGNRSDVDIALPALRAHARTAEFFVLAGRFDDPRYLSRDDCRTLVDQGMTVGLHGRDHLDWRRLDRADLDDEIVASRDEVAAAAGRAVEAVGIPFGRYDRRVIAHLERQGFARIYTSDGGAVRAGARIKGRTSVRSDMPVWRIGGLLTERQPAATRFRRSVSTFLRRRLI